MEEEKDINQLTAHLFRELSGKMIAVLSHTYGLVNLDCIMDAVQDTFETALKNWRFHGLPDNPSAWLMKVARNKVINAIQKEGRSTTEWVHKADFEPEPEVEIPEHTVQDSQVQLLIRCCQLKLPDKPKIILTLRVLCGFGIPEISNALFMSEESVRKAFFRAKQELRQTGIKGQIPLQTDLKLHREIIHTIVYLLFNEGYKASGKAGGVNADLCFEAIRLAKIMRSVNEHDQEINALLALMFFQVARFPARITSSGEWLTLEEQNRSLWNKRCIREGFFYLDAGRPLHKLNKVYMEALIASVHCAAPDYESTNWQYIISLYRQLEDREPASPLIKLNRIIAESHVNLSERLMLEVKAIEACFTHENRFVYFLGRAFIAMKLQLFDEAENHYRKALDLARSQMDRNFISRKLKECDAALSRERPAH